MKVGIMQPYFFPYLGYFQLIKATDKWVVFDDIQYIRHGWVSRNRILHSDLDKDWLYIIVPLKNHPRNIHICDIKILNSSNWRSKILGQLAHYKKKAPYFKETQKVIKSCLSFKNDSLSKLNIFCLEQVCKYLNIKFHYQIFSNMDIKLQKIKNPGDWALEISKILKADEYINSSSGEKLFNKEKFAKAGIKLSFLKMKPIEYEQKKGKFISDLSIIDAMMFNPKRKIRQMLDNYQIC